MSSFVFLNLYLPELLPHLQVRTHVSFSLVPLTTISVAILKTFSHHLSEYERKEILDFPSVYWYGTQSKKQPAVLHNSANNHGYDDERGDYLVVDKDHLAYRYEVIDTLGKGSFGQVLHCRDHCTGESVAIKIIRNKKRFHHQALVEIKILENLRKWVCSYPPYSPPPLFIGAEGCGRKAPCYQDDGVLLFSQSSLHRDGATQHQSL
jgi:hypothetical protein